MPLRPLVNGRPHGGGLGVRLPYEGRMLSVVPLLLSQPDPTDDESVRALASNFWHCGTYPKIRRTVRRDDRRPRARGQDRGAHERERVIGQRSLKTRCATAAPMRRSSTPCPTPSTSK